MSATEQGLTVPDEIARAVMLPDSYAQLEEVVLPACAWLREHLPVGRAKIDGFPAVWLVARHGDQRDIASNQEVFHNGDFPHLPSEATIDFYRQKETGSRSFDYPSYMDPPEHPKFRASVMDHFQPRSIREHYEERARAFAKEAVDGLMERDGEADFVQDFAIHYPLRVILSVLGVSESEAPRMLEHTREFFGFNDPANLREEFKGLPDAAARQYAATIKDLQDYFRDLREQRRAEPSDDLITVINALEVDGRPWPDTYADSFLAGVAPAGHDTTSSTVSGGMLGLIRFPEQLEKVKADQKLIPGLVEESLRYTTPAKHFMREAVADARVGDAEVKAGDFMMMLFVSGNRDERVFPDPDAFDVTRRPNPHLTFSHGPHICTGLHLARLEMRILWEELIPRLGTVELAGDIELERANLVSGLRTLPIRFTKA
jgi:alpha-terpineol hydroxylase